MGLVLSRGCKALGPLEGAVVRELPFVSHYSWKEPKKTRVVRSLYCWGRNSYHYCGGNGLSVLQSYTPNIAIVRDHIPSMSASKTPQLVLAIPWAYVSSVGMLLQGCRAGGFLGLKGLEDFGFGVLLVELWGCGLRD